MKRLWFTLVFLIGVSPVYAESQWTKGEPAGTEAAGTIDDLIRVNNDAIDRLAYNYRRNLTTVPATVNTLSVLEGEVAIPNAAGSIVRWRRNTSTTTLTWADIDTGAEANSTQYYIYALADTDATTCTFKVSTNATSPSGATYYRKIGYFYNDSSGNIVSVGNIKGGDVSNIISVTGTSDITNAAESATDMTDMTLYFYSSGRPVRIIGNIPNDTHGGATTTGYTSLIIDGTTVTQRGISALAQTRNGSNLFWQTILSVGVHTIKVQWWKSGGGSIYQDGATYNRILSAEEL